METTQAPLSTEITSSMTDGVARALVRVHRTGMKVITAADLQVEQELAEATGLFVMAFANYRAKLDIGGERNVTLALSADQHAALSDVKRCAAHLSEVLASEYSHHALSIAHFELVRALDLWRRVVHFPTPVFRGATSLRFE